MRNSTTTSYSDSAGIYEEEVFVCNNPAKILIGIHGNGVRRWDGEKFYYLLAEHFTDSVVSLVDQNQPEKNGCKLNSLDIMTSRVQNSIERAKRRWPDKKIWVVAHSMGCGVASLLDTQNLTGIVFVAPAVGDQTAKYITRYGVEILDGKEVSTSDGLYKNISKEFMSSVQGVIWQEKYTQLLQHFPNIHVFESGADEIVDTERFELRTMPFASYEIIEGAPHNYSGTHAATLFERIEQLW